VSLSNNMIINAIEQPEPGRPELGRPGFVTNSCAPARTGYREEG
jgi:hypothetical protein